MNDSNDKTITFQPFISPENMMPEFSIKAIILGAIFGLIFGAATVYLALKAGLTVSASIPIAVLSIAVFKKLGKSTILENNIVQTIGSAGESIAAGVAFTFPAFIFLTGGIGFFNYFNVFSLALVGGILGVLFMIPLRRSLIVKEHGVLPYPEGTACADVLIAGEKGGSMARYVFSGLGIAAVYKILMQVLGLWKETPGYTTPKDSALPNAQVSADAVPEYLGVGYIIGPRISGILVAGGVLSYLVLIPLIAFLGDKVKDILPPAGDLIRNLSPDQIRSAYVRYIGAGAVAAGGLITLIRTLPTIISAFKDSFKSMRDVRAGVVARRTERDIPITYVVIGSLILVIVVAILPQLPGSFPGTLLMGLLVVIFGFFFVTVSSRIVGLIGSSNNPISGMTIATLMGTCLIFLAIGWNTPTYQSLALVVGSIVCIAAANAGATSQDLKTGHIVGATPRYQQLGLVIGVVVSTFIIGITLNMIDQSQAYRGPEFTHLIGSKDFPAPQATLMATVIKGILSHDLPWGLIFVGMLISICVELCGIRSLSFAVGVYLPLSTTLPIYIGGMLKSLVDKMRNQKNESEVSPGMLFSTGLVAGGSVLGVIVTVLSGWTLTKMVEGAEKTVSVIDTIKDAVNVNEFASLGAGSDLIGAIMFAVLCFFLVRTAMKKTDTL